MNKYFTIRLTLTVLFLAFMYQFTSCMLIAGANECCEVENEYVNEGVGVVNYIDAPEYIDLGTYKLTAYCACVNCCGKTDGITSTGVKATSGRTIAVDPEVIPYGSEVVIDGHTYIAEDCGGAIRGKRIDVYFDTHQEALEFGVRYENIKIKN